MHEKGVTETTRRRSTGQLSFNVEIANGDLDVAVDKPGEVQKMSGSGRAEDAHQKAAEFRGA